MLIGTPKEIKNHEYRVGLTPESALDLIVRGHRVMVETNAGKGIGYDDQAYQAVGVEIIDTAAEIFAKADMIVKVKEPQAQEVAMLRPGQILFTYLHLAANKSLTTGLLNSNAVCIAYETVTDARGKLPLLAPMSEVAGRMSVQVGAHYLEKASGGSGVLLGGVSGVYPGKVTILGGGIAGMAAARMASGLMAEVVIFDKSGERLLQIDEFFQGKARTLFPTRSEITHHVQDSDLVIGAILVPGAAAQKIITHAMVQTMKKGSVMVDVAIDQGGCFETSRPTTHQDPIYDVDGITHYCVTNIPGAVAQTSTRALNNVILPFAMKIADKGWETAIKEDKHLGNGLNICQGYCTNQEVAREFDLDVKYF